jgi:DNA-binding response OmpR family regulator
MAHILLVDDEVLLAQFISFELSEGYQVTIAHDGMTGLAIARQSPPDLALLNWMMF